MSAPGMSAPRLALVATWESTDLDTDGPFLIPACEAIGFDVSVPVWRDPDVDWSSFDVVVVRATWDYFDVPEEFLAWVASVNEVTTLWNPAAAIAWNLDKRYLDEVAEAGFPVIETTFVADEETTVPAYPGRVVVKPTVSAGSNDTMAYDDGTDPAVTSHIDRIVAAGRVAMVQPYVEAIDTEGERGLVYYRGVLDHSFSKAAILVGERNEDGLFARETITAATSSPEEQSLADSVMDWLTNTFGGLLYTRIDIVNDGGQPAIMELELIEPSFFLETDPASADRFAKILRRLAP